MAETDELYFNIRLEGSTTFKVEPGTVMPDSTGDPIEITVPTVVLIEAGLSGWKDEHPYRAQVNTEFRGDAIDAEDIFNEHTFRTDAELCTWLEKYLADLKTKGFELVRYKANGCAIDWLNRIGLPPDPDRSPI